MPEFENADDEPLDVDMSGSRGTAGGVAIVLEKSAKLLRDMPDGARYDFELTIEEVDD